MFSFNLQKWFNLYWSAKVWFFHLSRVFTCSSWRCHTEWPRCRRSTRCSTTGSRPRRSDTASPRSSPAKRRHNGFAAFWTLEAAGIQMEVKTFTLGWRKSREWKERRALGYWITLHFWQRPPSNKGCCTAISVDPQDKQKSEIKTIPALTRALFFCLWRF